MYLRHQEQGQEEQSGRRPRRSAATAASMSLKYMSGTDGDAVDNRMYGSQRNVQQMIDRDREDAADEQAGDDVVFQTPKAPAPRKSRGTPAAASGGGRRGCSRAPPGGSRAS